MADDTADENVTFICKRERLDERMQIGRAALSELINYLFRAQMLSIVLGVCTLLHRRWFRTKFFLVQLCVPYLDRS